MMNAYIQISLNYELSLVSMEKKNVQVTLQVQKKFRTHIKPYVVGYGFKST